MKPFEKIFGCKAIGVSGAEITADMLAKINAFALNPLSAEQIYVRKFLLCHSGIDRDVERFPIALLEDFAASLPGKSFLFVHDRRSLPFALFFDASTEAMTTEQFKSFTGSEARLPEGEASISVLWAWSYMLNEDFNAPVMKNIDGGVYRHVSIGFNATDLTAVKKEINGPTLYWEYVPPGEAMEGSLVWLGAQPGATSQKALKDQETIKQEENEMKGIISLLIGLGIKSLTDTATEEQVSACIKMLIDEKNARITDLETDAALGKSYKDKTIDNYVALKHKLGEVGDEPEKHATMKQIAAGLPFVFLEEEVKALQKRIEQKFPDKSQLPGESGESQRVNGDDIKMTEEDSKKYALVA